MSEEQPQALPDGEDQLPSTSSHDIILAEDSSPTDDDDEEDEAFVYRASSPDHPLAQSHSAGDEAQESEQEQEQPAQPAMAPAENDSDDEEFSYLAAQPETEGDRRMSEPTEATSASTPPPSAPPVPAAPVDYTLLHRLCLSGSLEPLQHFFADTIETSQVSSFVLANEPNPTSGLMPIHYAAKEGKLEILKWLVADVGALVDIEDREGEVSAIPLRASYSNCSHQADAHPARPA